MAKRTAVTKISKPKGRTMPKRCTKNRTTNSPVDVTLPDGNFLDSFDKFIAGEKKNLKNNRVLKTKVRASFNRDSSVDMTQNKNVLHSNSDQIDDASKENGGTASLPQKSAKTRIRYVRPTRAIKGKQTKPCDSNSSATKNKRLKRKPIKLTVNDNTFSDTVFCTPFIQKRRKKTMSSSPVFDKMAGLVTSTPACNKVGQDINSAHGETNTDVEDSMSERSILNVSMATEPEIIELAETISSDASKDCQSQVISSFSQLINSSANAEMYKTCKLLPTESRSIYQLYDSSENDLTPTEKKSCNNSAIGKSDVIVLCDAENNQNVPNRNNVPLSNVSEKQRARSSKVEDVNRRNIRFITNKTISSSLESSPDKNDAITHHKLVIKSGKWRRTLYEMRNKIMQSPRASDNFERNLLLAKVERPSVNHRKSIFVKHIVKRTCSTRNTEQLGKLEIHTNTSLNALSAQSLNASNSSNSHTTKDFSTPLYH